MSSLSRILRRPVVAVLAVGILAAVLRFNHLSYPRHSVFDEVYYPKSACIFLGYSDERCRINSANERFWRENQNDTGAWVHPPLGKWAIAVGELISGTGSYGWRVSSAVTGTATVVLLAVMVQLLFGSVIWTYTAGLLLAVENLNFLVSRTGILDIFVTFWILLGFVFMLLDRRWIEKITPEPPPEDMVPDDPARPRLPKPLWRPWRIAAGAAFGAGVATKWSAVTGIAAAVLLAYVWEASRRKRWNLPHPLRRAISVETFGLVIAFLFLPAGIYVASYLGWFLHFGWNFNAWATMQRLIFDFQAGLRSSQEGNPYQSGAWQWLLLWRPVLFHSVKEDGIHKVIFANGNPAIFWGSLLAIPYGVVAWIKRRDWRAGFVIITVLALYLPWFLSSHPEYIFYAAPITPFFVLACVYGLKAMTEYTVGEGGSVVRPLLPVAVVFVVVAIGLFVFFWPTLTAGPLSHDAYRLRQWLPSWGK